MGFRLASLRRTNVVMAPACTYIILVEDFSILIEYHPVGCVVINAGDHSRKCTEQFRLMYVIVFRIFANKKTVRHANGDLFGCARVNFRENDVVNEKNFEFSGTNAFRLVATAYSIMNKIDSMESKTDMGLQNIDMPNFDASLNMKDKRCAPGVDILSNLEKEICRNGTTNFQQDCEEFLKLISSTDSEEKVITNASPMINGQVFPETNEIQNLDNDLLLNHVDTLENEASALPPPTTSSSATSYADVSEDNRKKCLQMERRIDRLTRRLKLKQSKLYGLHTSEQISSFLDLCRCKFVDLQQPPTSHSDLTMDTYLKRLKRCSEQSCVPQNNDRYHNYFGSGPKEYKNGRVSTISVTPKFNSTVYGDIEKISGELYAQVKAIAHDFDSDITASSSGCESLDEETCQPSTEFADERLKKIPLNKRATWRWMRSRASIACRLSWLQSRMSALEYKIHHYTEIYKKLRCAKGQVLLQNDSERLSSSSSAAAAAAAGTTTPATTNGPSTPVKENALPQLVLNGFHGSLSSSTAALSSSPLKALDAVAPAATTDGGSVSCGELDDTCSRACPLLKSKFRKRNLIRLDGPTTQTMSGGISSSRPKYSSVRCDCVPPLSCVLCAARGPGVDLSYQHVYSNLLPVQSKIALLEPTFHSVLSFPSDVSLSTHLSACLNSEDVLALYDKGVENRTTTSTAAGKRYYSNYKTTEEIRRANSESGTEFKRRKKYIKRQPNNSQNIAFSRNQLIKQRHIKLDKTLSMRKRRRKRLLSKRHKATDNGLEESIDDGLYYKKEKEEVFSSQPSSPHSSHSSTVKDPSRRKRGQSYDIDNFIIPPNSTPTAVVSKPQYKEILIPTWKVVQEKAVVPNSTDKEAIPDHILEDLSDDAVVKYHDMLEQNERKKFRTNSIRHGGRSRKRTDSYPETSETNTPERVASPPPALTSGEPSSTIASSDPATLGCQTPATTFSPSNQNYANPKNKFLTSSKKSNSVDYDNSFIAENTSAEVAPYDRRIFPLSDDEYKELLASLLNTKFEDSLTDTEQETEIKPNEVVNDKAESPFSGSLDSTLEDTNDPDWMAEEEFPDRNPEAPYK